MTLLNEAGNCAACARGSNCPNHADRPVEGPCQLCRRQFCLECVPQFICPACLQAGPPRHKASKGPVPLSRQVVAKALPTSTRQRWMLGGLVGTLVLIQGGYLAYDYLSGPPAPTAEERYRARVATVVSAVQAIKGETGKLPPDGDAITTYLKTHGVTPPKIVGGAADGVPGSAIYLRKGKTYEVKAVTDEGAIFREAGRPLAERD
jgi:hypothetical protein